MANRLQQGGRSVAWCLLGASGAFRLGRRVTRYSVPVLTYHRIHPDGPWTQGPRRPTIVSTSEFDAHLSHLARYYHIATGDEFRAFVAGAALPPRSVLITFDDGYRDNHREALPILQRHGATAIFFVATRFIGARTNRLWLDRLDAIVAGAGELRLAHWLAARGLPVHLRRPGELRAFAKQQTRARRDAVLSDLDRAFGALAREEGDNEPLTWEELGALASAGMTIGSHTATHQILGAASPEELRDELHASRMEIERRLGVRCWAFSYPNGETHDFGPDAMRAVQETGYTCAFTQMAGFVDRNSDSRALPRIPVPASPNLDVFLGRLTGIHAWLTTAGTGSIHL